MKNLITIVLFFCVAYGYQNMTPRAKQAAGIGPSYEAKAAITNGTSDWILIHQDIKHGVSANVITASNTCYVEYTFSSFFDITNGTATAFRWGNGTVSTNAADSWFNFPSAMRLVGLTNKSWIEVFGQ